VAGLINGMDVAVIIPEGMHLKETKGMGEVMHFYNFFGYLYLGFGLFLFVALFFFSVPIYSTISSYKPGVLHGHRNLLLLSSGLPILIILSNYLTTVLTTLKYFTAPLIVNGIAQLCALIALILFHNQVGISSVLAGLLAGYIINIFLLLFFMRMELKWNFNYLAHKLSKRIKQNLLSVQLGNLTSFAYNYGIIVLLSSLATGIYSAYNYSMQIINIPIIFIVTQTAAVSGIKFNELAAKNQYKQLNKIFQESLGILLFFVVPVCFLTYLYADVIVRILFLRSKITSEAAATVVLFIKYLTFLLPCISINTFLSRLLMSIKKVNQSFYFQVGFNIVMLVAIFVFTKLFYLKGFMWSMLTVYYLYSTVVCIFLMKWLMPYIEYRKFLWLFLQIILLNLPLCIIFLLFFKHLVFIIPVVYAISLLLINKATSIIPHLNLNIFKLSKL
jgi:O-antigen/teichoic acid export membrane protein